MLAGNADSKVAVHSRGHFGRVWGSHPDPSLIPGIPKLSRMVANADYGLYDGLMHSEGMEVGALHQS